MKLEIDRNSRLLFIGDSITDCGRLQDPDGLGGGYPRLIRDYLLARNPATAPVILNTGISGNRVPDLQGRWQSDVIDLRPDMLSVKIGINDVWHGLPGKGKKIDLDEYTTGYREILGQYQRAFPKGKVVLFEPSIISPPQPPQANDLLKPFVQAVHELGREFGAFAVVPLHEVFLEVCRVRPDVKWTSDGVHPTSAGHALIARQWLTATGLL